MKVDIKSSMILALTALSLTACGSLPSAMTASTSAEGGSLSTLSVGGAATDADATAVAQASGRPEGFGKGGHKGGPGGHGGPGMGGPIGFGFIHPHQLASLNLTDDQKTQIEAIQAETKSFMEANKPTADNSATRPDPEAERAAFEAAFKSDQFDASSLTANRPTPPTPSAAIIDFQVAQIIKLHDVLTTEQRAQIFAEPTEPSTRPSPPADAAERQSARLDELATKLSLSDAQKSQLSAIFSAEASQHETEREAHKAARDAERAALKNVLTADTVDSSALKALIEARVNQGPPKLNDQFEKLEQIHAILNTEQRALWLTLNKGPGGPGGPGGEHAGGRGPGGPGGRPGRG